MFWEKPMLVFILVQFFWNRGKQNQQNLMLLCLNIRCLDIKALNFQQRENYLRRREEEEASGGNWPALQKEEKLRKSNAKWHKQIITFGEMFFAKVLSWKEHVLYSKINCPTILPIKNKYKKTKYPMHYSTWISWN